MVVAMVQDPKNGAAGDVFHQARNALAAEVAAELQSIIAERKLPIATERVLYALAKVPRHEFVPDHLMRHAYRNRPLEIGHGQTISQPLIVALMSALADVQKSDKVLEVGTGSGYQAAVLGELAGSVFSIEIIEPLGRQAEETLRRLGYENVHTRIGDGYAGWPEEAPFDAIVVTAAPDYIPQPLVEQLKPGGKLVIPVGDFQQELVQVEKLADGSTRKREVIPVRFVPLTREN
ncbi:MAG: protein-L-isoaspartate(D-aspartate) O-methyltransferase [Alphaproteobacteria bacterium]|nr:protein-L-isoaspartate(D-aspartate) O-methyltransferase [Alphaproteobacteria bacterium]